MTSLQVLLAQPSGGPYGPVPQTYQILKKGAERKLVNEIIW
jgi:hypothetical protein